MRAYVVYESMFGNTAVIGQAIADGLGQHLEVESHNVSEGLPVSGTGLLVLGGPTHAFSMSRTATRQDAVTQGANADPQGRAYLKTPPSLAQDAALIAPRDHPPLG